jgi:hypothetical protein
MSWIILHRSLAPSAGQAAPRLLQECGALVHVVLASNCLSPLDPRAALDGHRERNPASVDPAAPVRKHPPLLVAASPSESNSQQHIPT